MLSGFCELPGLRDVPRIVSELVTSNRQLLSIDFELIYVTAHASLLTFAQSHTLGGTLAQEPVS